MGMVTTFRSVSVDAALRIEEDPHLVEALFGGSPGGVELDLGGGMTAFVAGADEIGDAGRELLEGLGGVPGSETVVDPTTPAPLPAEFDAGREVYLDKAWDILELLLFTEDEQGVLGRAGAIGDPEALTEMIEAGGMPPLYVAPEGVAAVAARVAEVTVAELPSRHDPERFEAQGISGDAADPEYYSGYYEEVRPFFAHAAQHGLGLVIGIG